MTKLDNNSQTEGVYIRTFQLHVNLIFSAINQVRMDLFGERLERESIYWVIGMRCIKLSALRCRCYTCRAKDHLRRGEMIGRKTIKFDHFLLPFSNREMHRGRKRCRIIATRDERSQIKISLTKMHQSLPPITFFIFYTPTLVVHDTYVDSLFLYDN